MGTSARQPASPWCVPMPSCAVLAAGAVARAFSPRCARTLCEGKPHAVLATKLEISGAYGTETPYPVSQLAASRIIRSIGERGYSGSDGENRAGPLKAQDSEAQPLGWGLLQAPARLFSVTRAISAAAPAKKQLRWLQKRESLRGEQISSNWGPRDGLTGVACRIIQFRKRAHCGLRRARFTLTLSRVR